MNQQHIGEGPIEWCGHKYQLCLMLNALGTSNVRVEFALGRFLLDDPKHPKKTPPPDLPCWEVSSNDDISGYPALEHLMGLFILLYATADKWRNSFTLTLTQTAVDKARLPFSPKLLAKDVNSQRALATELTAASVRYRQYSNLAFLCRDTQRRLLSLQQYRTHVPLITSLFKRNDTSGQDWVSITPSPVFPPSSILVCDYELWRRHTGVVITTVSLQKELLKIATWEALSAYRVKTDSPVTDLSLWQSVLSMTARQCSVADSSSAVAMKAFVLDLLLEDSPHTQVDHDVLLRYLTSLDAKLSEDHVFNDLPVALDDVRQELQGTSYMPAALSIIQEEKHNLRLSDHCAAQPDLHDRIWASRHSPISDGQGTQTSLTELSVHLDHMILLGDPGSGKSQWLKSHAREMAKATLAHSTTADSTKRFSRTPIFADLRTVAATLAKNTELVNTMRNLTHECPQILTLAQQFIAAVLVAAAERYCLPEQLIPLYWKQLQNSCRQQTKHAPHLHLDGFDEASSHYDSIREPLGQFMASTSAKVVITSRLTAFSDDILPPSNVWQLTRGRVLIQPLTPEKVVQLTQQIFGKNDARTKRLHDLLTSSPQVRGLLQNPLLLILLCRAVAVPDTITSSWTPESRTDIYDRLIRDFIAQRPRYGKAQPNGELSNALLTCLSEMALAFYPSDVFDQASVSDFLWKSDGTGYLDELHTSHPLSRLCSQIGTSAFSDYLCSLGILVHTESPHSSYTFLHLTFHEYLAARGIYHRADWMDFAISKIYDPPWQQPLAILGGLAGVQIRPYVSKLLEMNHEDLALRPLELAVMVIAETPRKQLPGHIENKLFQALLGAIDCELPTCWPFSYGYIYLAWGHRSVEIAREIISDSEHPLHASAQLFMDELAYFHIPAPSGGRPAGISEPTTALSELLSDQRPSEWRLAIPRLSRLTEEQALPYITFLLQASTPALILIGLEVLARHHSQRAVPMLQALIKHPRHDIRSSAIATLGSIDASDDTLSFFELHIESLEYDVQCSIVRALGSISNPGTERLLLPVTKFTRRSVLAEAIESSARQAFTSAVPDIVSALSHKSSRIRSSALKALGQMGTATHIPLVILGLQDKHSDVVKTANMALRRMKERGMAQLVDNSLRAATPELIYEGPPYSVTTIGLMLHDPSPETRMDAIYLAYESNEPDAIHLLCDFVNSNSTERLSWKVLLLITLLARRTGSKVPWKALNHPLLSDGYALLARVSSLAASLSDPAVV